MSNSSLIDYTKLSPNHSGERTKDTDTISIHCMAGNLTVEACGALFSQSSREASSNYGVGSDGRRALYVPENYRSWCTSNAANDQRAVTIEVANNGGAPDWPISDKAYDSLIELVTDICERNGIKKLVWSTNKDDRINHRNGCNMTVHRDFAAKACPGDYIYERLGQIAKEVNARLGVAEDNPTTDGCDIAKGSTVRVKQGAKAYDGGNLASFVYDRDHVVSEISGDRCVITYGGVVVAAVRKSDLTLVSGGGTISQPSTSAPSNPASTEIVKGSTVRVKQGAKTYDGGNLASFVYERDHIVSEMSGDRCVITYGGVTVAAVSKSDLTLVSGGASESKPTTPAFNPYTVKVSVTELRIRSGPGTNTAAQGFIQPGVYTIVEEADGPGAKRWGKLKSGAGWISLDYATKC